jgi:GntR family transcriptional regulator, transcriptional repressor for pyruvate dehydrogenase complex
MTQPPQPPPLSRETLADQVARHVLHLIASQSLRAGDQLASEIQISQQLGVSRPIVREAYRTLAAAGLIVVASGKRPRVGHLNASGLSQLFQHAVNTEQVSVQQVLELRRSVEVGAVQLAAKQRTSNDLQAIESALIGMTKALQYHENPNLEEFVHCDVQFHLAIAKASANPLFVLCITALQTSLEASIRLGMQHRRTIQQRQAVNQVHQVIFQAISNGNEQAATTAMHQHFEDALGFLNT